VQHPFEVSKHRWKLGSPVPLLLGEVMFVDLNCTENWSSLTCSESIFLFERFAVVRFALWVLLQRLQAIGEAVVRDFFYWVE
jgi:hypothetical protein